MLSLERRAVLGIDVAIAEPGSAFRWQFACAWTRYESVPNFRPMVDLSGCNSVRSNPQYLMAIKERNVKSQYRSFWIWALAIVSIMMLLGWELSQGGVVSHHLLNDPKLPAISNLWGLITLPALAWLTNWRLRSAQDVKSALLLAGGICLFALVFGILFLQGYEDLLLILLAILLLSALFLPLYRAECAFGFVLVLMWFFGPVLPLVIWSVPSLLSALSLKVVYPIIRRWLGWRGH
jgi:hypothetical protein